WSSLNDLVSISRSPLANTWIILVVQCSRSTCHVVWCGSNRASVQHVVDASRLAGTTKPAKVRHDPGGQPYFRDRSTVYRPHDLLQRTNPALFGQKRAFRCPADW